LIKEALDKAGATCYCKTSGASGIHIYIPLKSVSTFEQARPFAELVANLVNEQSPSFTTLERSLIKRKDRIDIDYLQNRRSQTLSSAYSIRPVAGTSGSAPLLWKELRKGLNPLDFHILNTKKRTNKIGDIFPPVLMEKNNLERCLKSLR